MGRDDPITIVGFVVWSATRCKLRVEIVWSASVRVPVRAVQPCGRFVLRDVGGRARHASMGDARRAHRTATLPMPSTHHRAPPHRLPNLP